MDADRFARNMSETLAHKLALRTPEAAQARFSYHMDRWLQDVENRLDFYGQVVDAAIPTLTPADGDVLRRVWDGMIARLNAATDEERAEIDAWLEPLVEADAPAGKRSWMSILMDCEGGYFSPKIEAELRELVAVPGFYDIPLRYQGKR